MTDSQTDRPLPNAARPLITPTYDGSGEAVHPDILFFPNGWRGWEYWLVITPYPGDDTSKENPSILVSHDGITWREPAASPIPSRSRASASWPMATCSTTPRPIGCACTM